MAGNGEFCRPTVIDGQLVAGRDRRQRFDPEFRGCHSTIVVFDFQLHERTIGLTTVIHVTERGARFQRPLGAERHAVIRFVLGVVNDRALDRADQFLSTERAQRKHAEATGRGPYAHTVIAISGIHPDNLSIRHTSATQARQRNDLEGLEVETTGDLGSRLDNADQPGAPSSRKYDEATSRGDHPRHDAAGRAWAGPR